MKKNSQKGIILNYMQNHKRKAVTWKDFMGRLFYPFVWYSANCRLSELLKQWLVKEVWYKKWVLQFSKAMPMKLYKITDKWLEIIIN